MQEKRDEFDRFYCVPQPCSPAQGLKPIVSMTQEAVRLLDTHYERLTYWRMYSNG